MNAETLITGLIEITPSCRIGFDSLTLTWEHIGIEDIETITTCKKAGWTPPTIRIAPDTKAELKKPIRKLTSDLDTLATSENELGGKNKKTYIVPENLPKALQFLSEARDYLEAQKALVISTYDLDKNNWLELQKEALEKALSSSALDLEKQRKGAENALTTIESRYPTVYQINQIQIRFDPRRHKSLKELAEQSEAIAEQIAQISANNTIQKALMQAELEQIEATKDSIQNAIENARQRFEELFLEQMDLITKEALGKDTTRDRQKLEKTIEKMETLYQIIQQADTQSDTVENRLNSLNRILKTLPKTDPTKIESKVQEIKNKIKETSQQESKKVGHRTVEMML